MASTGPGAGSTNRPAAKLAITLATCGLALTSGAPFPDVVARAQDAPARPTPPRLTEFVPSDPPAGLEDRDAAVVLEITVSAEGSVSDVRVVESAGEGLEAFDAQAAAKLAA